MEDIPVAMLSTIALLTQEADKPEPYWCTAGQNTPAKEQSHAADPSSAGQPRAPSWEHKASLLTRSTEQEATLPPYVSRAKQKQDLPGYQIQDRLAT